MNREDIDRLAVRAGFPERSTFSDLSDIYPRIERFAELVRADEREKYKWDVHSCGPTCKRYACVAVREAVESEREAIIDLVAMYGGPVDLEAAIRARSNT